MSAQRQEPTPVPPSTLAFPLPCACGHRWGIHDPFGKCLDWNKAGDGRIGCRCADYRPREVSRAHGFRDRHDG